MKKILYTFLYLLFKNLPSHYRINHLRGKIIGMYALGTKHNLQIGRAVNIANPAKIIFGDNVVVNAEVYLIAGNDTITIGDGCLIAPRCFIQTQNHNYENSTLQIREQGSRSAPVIIESDCWLAYNTVILPGVTVRKGCVIGACAVVTKETEPYGVYAGIPARKIKERQ